MVATGRILPFRACGVSFAVINSARRGLTPPNGATCMVLAVALSVAPRMAYPKVDRETDASVVLT